MTQYFIIAVFLFIILYDVFLLMKKGGTITSVIRRWYSQFIFVPFTIGVIFLGHFLNYIHISDQPSWIIGGLAGFGLPVLVVSIVLDKKGRAVPKWLVPVIIAAGYLVGDVFF